MGGDGEAVVRPGQCGDVGEGRERTRRHEQVHWETERLASFNRESERRRKGHTKKKCDWIQLKNTETMK